MSSPIPRSQPLTHPELVTRAEMVLGMVALLLLGSVLFPGHVRAAPADPLVGTLDTNPATAGYEHQAGIELGMMELNWAAYEPEEGRFDEKYERRMQDRYAQLHAAGLPVTLGLGLHYTPAWVDEIPDSHFVDEDGHTSDIVNFVFNARVRAKAAAFIARVDQGLGLDHFQAIRIASGGRSELLYPSGGHYWAFDDNALRGDALPSSVGRNPFPNWRPGNSGLSTAQRLQWSKWYVGALADVADWQIKQLRSHGFRGYAEILSPGVGVTPWAHRRIVAGNLTTGALGTGAAWHVLYGALRDNWKVVAHISSMADGSGDNRGCSSSDTSVPLSSDATAAWSAARWISRIADEYGFDKSGENPGFAAGSDQAAAYRDTSSSGMMAVTIRQAKSCGFRSIYWAHDAELWNNTVSLNRLVALT